jgi:hypothetical protein
VGSPCDTAPRRLDGIRWLVLSLALVASTSACLWRGYDKIINVHLDVLTQMSRKMVLMAETGSGLSTAGLEEYAYPARRARQFLAQFDTSHDRPSYQHFAKLLDRYEGLVKAVGATRNPSGLSASAIDWLHRERDAIGQQAVKIRAAVEAGR